MNHIDILSANIILNEACLLHLGNLEKTVGDLILKFKISEWNFTKKFFADWQVPNEHDAARSRIQELFKGEELKIICRNVARLEIDRAGSNPGLLLASRNTANDGPSGEAWLGPLTVFGSGFKKDSELLKSLGDIGRHFFHWTLHIVEGRIDIVAQSLELPNFPREAVRQGASLF